MLKNIKTILIIAASFLLIGTVTFIADKSLSKKPVCNDTVGTSYTAVIQNNAITPPNTDAKLCDTLTIINTDDANRILAFGQHDSHIVYDGKSETLLTKDQSLKIVLSKKGTFIFHDHDNEDVKGTFTVK